MSTRELRPLAPLDGPSALPFDIVRAKIEVPRPRAGSVYRAALVNRLRAARRRPVVSVVGGAGSGKTTLVSQWAERDGRPVAWVSVDDRDNDAIVLLRHLAAALDRLEPVEPATLESLRSRRRSIWTTVLPRLTSAVASRTEPTIIVLDNASRLSSQESLDAVTSLAEHVRPGSTLLLAGRCTPAIPIAALRARGELLELEPNLLALTRREAALILHRGGVELPDDRLDDLVRRTEGWAAGVYLAMLALRETNDVGGDDRYFAEYFRSECLSWLDAGSQSFLRRASVLDRLSGSLCDAVLDRADSGRRLETLAAANMFVVPLDRRGEWYRFHTLFRELLQRELALHERRRVPTLRRRAARWYEAQGDHEAAVSYAIAAGDLKRAARLLGSHALSACEDGRFATVEQWLGAFDEPSLERYPRVAAVGAWVHALRGRPADAERWLAAAERAAGADDEAIVSVVVAALCRDGVEQMAADARKAAQELPSDSAWRPVALLLEGASRALAGDRGRASEVLADAEDEAQRRGAGESLLAAVSERALASDDNDSESLALQVHELACGRKPGQAATDALGLAVSARASLRRAHWDEAHAELDAVKELLPRLSHALPWLGVQTLLELVRANVTLRDPEAARARLDEARKILRHRPKLGVLRTQAAELERQVEELTSARGRESSALTAAELRLLPLLATHFSFREIAERFFVSRNTVKTQAISVYRKLGVSSRSQAIAEALRLGLIDTAEGLETGSSTQ